MTAVEIERYTILHFGGKEGYQNSRAAIQLYDADKLVGLISFYDDNMEEGNESVKNGIINMRLPYTTFSGVMEILRNEKPIQLDFRQDRGFLMTTKEPIGNNE